MSIKKTALELLEDIKKALKFEDTATPNTPDPNTPAPVQLTAYKLADGSEIMISALEVGGDVTIADAPAPAGTYVLEDQSSIIVGEDGKIAELVAAPDAAPAAELPEDMNAKFEARVAKLELEAQEFKAAYETEKAQNFEVFNQKIEGQNQIIGQLVALVEQLAAVPDADIPAPKKTFSFSNVESKTKGLGKYAAAAQKLAEEQKN